MSNCKVTPSGNGFDYVEISNDAATAQIATLGAHVMSYQPRNAEHDVLWMSSKSFHQPGKPMRGGIPVCAPWFGGSPVAGRPSHGAMRQQVWTLVNVWEVSPELTVAVLELDSNDIARELVDFDFMAQMTVSVGRSLEVSLAVTNYSDQPADFSGALHTYFAISEISKIQVEGLAKTAFIDKVPGADPATGSDAGVIRFNGEYDRVFTPTQQTVYLVDSGWNRRIRIEKSGSNTTVVWNPWIEKSKKMADYGDEEYHEMVCVEAANAATDARVIDVGCTHVLTQKITLE